VGNKPSKKGIKGVRLRGVQEEYGDPELLQEFPTEALLGKTLRRIMAAGAGVLLQFDDYEFDMALVCTLTVELETPLTEAEIADPTEAVAKTLAMVALGKMKRTMGVLLYRKDEQGKAIGLPDRFWTGAFDVTADADSVGYGLVGQPLTGVRTTDNPEGWELDFGLDFKFRINTRGLEGMRREGKATVN
jgi:hypothetical protein